LAELLPFVQKEKVKSACKRKLQFHGQLACIDFSQDFLKLQLYVTDIWKLKETVSLIEIVLGPLISAVRSRLVHEFFLLYLL